MASKIRGLSMGLFGFFLWSVTAALFRYRIDTARVPGVAGTDTAQCQPAAAQQAESFDGGDGVPGTAGREAAVISQPGAEEIAVAFNQ